LTSFESGAMLIFSIKSSLSRLYTVSSFLIASRVSLDQVGRIRGKTSGGEARLLILFAGSAFLNIRVHTSASAMVGFHAISPTNRFAASSK
jgi:hypothetical protein